MLIFALRLVIASVLLKVELDKLFEQEELFWWQRSRVQWLMAGDKNSRFFHLSTIKRRQINSILSIRDDSGTWLKEKSAISQNISHFFQNLFSSSGVNDMDTVLDFIDTRISDDMNRSLMQPFSAEEIKQAAFSLGSSKAPGPDGFSGKFYQAAWPEVGESIYSMVRDFFAGNSVLQAINETNVTLIPKVVKPEHVSQFRPIGLCNFSYKIISKLMTNRMRPFLDDCISENQSAFVPGRCIHDNIIIAHEVYHYLRRKKTTAKFEFALKMDISKAYDRVEWDFLEKVLLRFGFCSDWVTLVMKCVRSVMLNICLAGETISSFSPGRGLRQGDPLSPYLFILVAEVLSLMIRKHQEAKRIRGVKLSQSCPMLTHSFFADDALFYMHASRKNCLQLAKILRSYCTASGQSINTDKSSIFFSTNMPDDVRYMVGNILGVPLSEDPGKYLGIPSIWGKTKTQALAYIRERVISKLQGWGHSLLSFAGREVMIKAVIQAIPIFPMNCFKFPFKTCHELNSLIAKFWWNGNVGGNSTHWKSWDSLTGGKDSGGMGFRDLIIMNNALLAKSAWRLMTRPQDLWARVVKSVYFPKKELVDAKKGHKASWCWSSILDGRDFLKQDLKWEVGTGDAIRIWGDNWVPSVSFPDQPTNTNDYYVSSGRVSDLIIDGVWDLTPIQHYLSDEIKFAIYNIPIPGNGLEDKLVWTNAKNGEYLVKLGYHSRKENGLVGCNKAGPSTIIPKQSWKSIWSIKTIPRVQQFIWRILSNALATNNALYHRKRSRMQLCPICFVKEETIEHLFFHCPWTICVWFGCSLGAKLDAASVQNFNVWWLNVTGTKLLNPQDISLICWILWLIWKQRNAMVFDYLQPNPLTVIVLALKNNLQFWESGKEGLIVADVVPNSSSPKSIWHPPPPEYLKVNCDGSFTAGLGAAIGVVCRDFLGHFRWGFVDKIKSISAFMTEALALKRALLLAVDLSHDKVIFESDCLSLIECVNAKAPDMIEWRCRIVIQDIICLLDSRVGFSVSFTPRRGNQVADFLAASAYKGVYPVGWVPQPTPSLISLLTVDLLEADMAVDDNAPTSL